MGQLHRCLLCEKETDTFSNHSAIPKLHGKPIKCCSACNAMILLILATEDLEEMNLMALLKTKVMRTYLKNRMSGGGW